ncbi:heavy metal-associated isoprenylated plant protein 35-like [Euphorbia lathyris]|uniref:heavy metal-associated isoprenylated plant protein 35-like n=1 Tax=Euphorbia lathyris TaxID=212925 RepID=UPI0033130C91
MATTTTSVEESSSKALKCKTWVLKVSIHCQGCKRKVKKVLLAIDGVYTATIDAQQQRVTVIGNIEVETLIKRLIKTGKHAEIWPEKLPSKEKQAGKPNNKQVNQNNSKGSQDSSNNDKKKTVTSSGGTKVVGKSPENSTVSEELPPEEGVSGAKSRGSRKKKKGQTTDNVNSNSDSTSASPSSDSKAENTHGIGINQAMGPSNLNPTRHQSVPYHPQGYNINIPPAYASNYRMPYPREYSYPGPFFYVPVSPYPRVTPLDSFFYFSDENAHGCSIM